MAGNRPIDITGERYGRLVALERLGRISGSSKWLCRCDCGTIHEAHLTHLRSGTTKSCGCLAKELNGTHRLTGSRIYWRYHGMRDRCQNPNNASYGNYGGRGIAISPEWEGFEAFAKWASENGYRDGLDLDRIDNDGDYGPTNCRWVSRQINSNNKRDNRMVTVGGVTRTLADTARHYGIEGSTFRKRLDRGLAPDVAVRPTEEIYGKAIGRPARIDTT